LRRLCGWETLGKVPSESTFSRAFDQFARDGRPQAIHKALIKTHYGETLAGHISRDATAIHAREKAEPKPKRPPEAKGGKRGRRRKDAPPAPPPEPKRLQQQLERDPEANLADLPTVCDWGCKKNSQSKKECWRGYKLHLDVIDGDIPVSAILTSASLHDSQVAIPLAQMSAERIVNLYDRADAAYDAREIREISARLGHVPIIDDNPGRGEKREFSPAEAVRYRERSAAERVNAHLHEQHGGRHVRVRGPVKVAAHLAFGLVVIAAEQMLRMLVSPRASLCCIGKAGSERREGRSVLKNGDSSPSGGQKPTRAQHPPFSLAEPLVVPGFKREPRGVLQVPHKH